MAPHNELLSRVLNCRNLPVIPAISLQVLQLTQDADVSAADLVRLLSQDPVLAAKVLRAANFAVPREVPTLHRAVVILGLRKVSTLALGVSLSATFGQVNSRSDSLEGVWRRSLYSALAGQILSREIGAGLEDEVFLCGLFQDVGVLAMLATLGEEYDAVLAASGEHESLVDMERQVFGTDHACVGAAMADSWSLPQRLVMSIACHHGPEQAPREVLPIARLVWASRVAANVLLAEDTSSAAHAAHDCLGKLFDLDGERIHDILERLSHEAEELAGVFEVKVLSESEMALTLVRAQETLVQAALDADAEVQRLNSLNRELSESAGRDKLTGLQNRTRIEETLAATFERAKENGNALSALFIDADRFKNINDTYGHATGDEVLRRLGRILSRICGDQAFRLGGEELLCLLPDRDVEQATAIAEDIRRVVEAEEIDNAGGVVRITVSIGVATMDSDCYPASAAELVAAADRAVYAAKDAGRNRVCVSKMAMCN